MRFNALSRLIPTVTQRMLTLHLRELERDGVVRRTVHSGVPAPVDYALTEKGVSLEPVLTAMVDWALTHGEAVSAKSGQSPQGR